MNSNKAVCTFNSNKPANSKIVHPVDTRKPVCPVSPSTLACLINSCNFMLPVDIRSVDSNKPLCPVNY